MIDFGGADDNTNCLAESRPVARELQVGEMHPQHSRMQY